MRDGCQYFATTIFITVWLTNQQKIETPLGQRLLLPPCIHSPLFLGMDPIYQGRKQTWFERGIHFPASLASAGGHMTQSVCANEREAPVIEWASGKLLKRRAEQAGVCPHHLLLSSFLPPEQWPWWPELWQSPWQPSRRRLGSWRYEAAAVTTPQASFTRVK